MFEDAPHPASSPRRSASTDPAPEATPTRPSQQASFELSPEATPTGTADRRYLPSDMQAYRRHLRETFGYPDFRGGQEEVLRALPQHDVLTVMPTGSGKSLCYVLPALQVGRTVVVSPLIALMQDQVESLQAVGVAATFINSNLDRAEQQDRYRRFLAGEISLLFVAPERFATPGFSDGLRRAGVHLLAIDEAHCISEWGHNFRPDYLQLGAIRERLGKPRTLALTATAMPQVRDDIVARLHLSADSVRVTTSIDRPNLELSVEPIASPRARSAWLIAYIRSRDEGSGIVYARTRKTVDGIAEELRAAGIVAAPYHAGLPRHERTQTQRRFQIGEFPVIVATNAFGMGIDKPDIRFVVHFNLPARIEAYYQEAGRAGRDGDSADCILLYARRDRSHQQRFIDAAHPSDGEVRETWQRWLRSARDGHLPPNIGADEPDLFASVIAALRASGLVDAVDLVVTSDDPYAPIDTSSVERHRDFAESRLRRLVEYAETTACRRALILDYFGEDAPDRCEACDNCTSAEPPDYPPDLLQAIEALRDQIASRSGRDPTRVFELRTAREVATSRPRTQDDLLEIWGIGETRASWLGPDLLRIVAEWERANPDAAPPAPIVSAVTSSGRAKGAAETGPDVSPSDPLYQAIRAWRLERARADGVPAFTLFSNRTLRELVASRPGDRDGLLATWGLGEAKVERFGDDLLGVLGDAPHDTQAVSPSH